MKPFFRICISAAFVFLCIPAFSQYQYRSEDNSEIIRSMLENRVPIQKKIIQPQSAAPAKTESAPEIKPAEQPLQPAPAPEVKKTAAKPAAQRKRPAAQKSKAKTSAGSAGSEMPAPAGADKTLLESGIHFYESGNYPAAADKLSQIRAKNPSGTYADQSSVWLSKVLLRQGKTAEALAELAKIPEDSGEYPYSLYLAAQIFQMERKYDESLENYAKISSRFPAHDLADNALIESGKLYLTLKNGQLSLSAAAQIVKSYPDRDTLDDAYYLIGMVLEKDQTLRDIEKAYLIFKKFVYRAETEKVPSFARSPLLSKVKEEIKFIEKNFLMGK